MDGLLCVIGESGEFGAILDSLKSGTKEQVVYGLSGSQKSYLLASLYSKVERPVFVVTYSFQQAERVRDDLVTLLPHEKVLSFPSVDQLPHEEMAESPDITSQHIQVMADLVRGERVIVVVPIKALMRKLIPVDAFAGVVAGISVGQHVDYDGFVRKLVLMGYERAEMVEGKGYFSVRGSIVDIYPPVDEAPVRVEFFGEEIESIRRFDTGTQRSIDQLRTITITPARKFVLLSEVRDAGIRTLAAELEKGKERLLGAGRREAARRLSEKVGAHIEKFNQGIYFDGDSQYAPFFYPELATLIKYARNPLVILDEPARLKESLAGMEAELREVHVSLLEEGEILPAVASAFASADELAGILIKHQTILLVLLSKGVDVQRRERVRTFQARPAPSFHGRLEALAKDVLIWRRKRYRIVMLVAAPDRGRRLVEVLKEYGIDSFFFRQFPRELVPGGVVITSGELESGFEFPSQRLVVLTDEEIYGAQKKKRRFAVAEEGAKISSFADLNPGDFVVHVNHGIGKYAGVETIEVGGVQRDYLVVKYSGEDKLYVPTDQVGLLQKYIGLEEAPPKVNKLGGTEWARVKSRVKESVQDMAKGLIELYASREMVKGYPFSPDTVWQKELEDGFAYEETPDQWKTIQEVKRDMEKPKPMDRLLCGDVGYGKTEVAVRAAFKAVMDGKQVAVLVPTTILAQQHFATFTDRFQGFPVSVAVLSRFQSDAEQKDILNGLRKGTIDVVIGTHRLIQPDIKFKDLGLVVVDEEQRFGVAHKEMLKELRKTVDVLTLTATPIPRTLHMSLIGLRDMSLIETPPENRYPIRTYIVEVNENLIREVILRELDRGGQVYYVHNRVQTIDGAAAYLKGLVPEARIAVAHGQMYEEKLERVMLQFLDREYDVLVCTTIIESGLDIPNVNTVIVCDADQMGLAQLYQLRGRVGRSNRVAYAYFMYRRDRVLSEAAEKRLHAIKEFTDLGSGFKIAMRDLEIRGAGNILGPEQHGYIASVGFELYCRLLQDAVKELKGEQSLPEPPGPTIEINVDAFIDDSYIPDARQKIEVYKKVNAIETIDESLELEQEIVDRFGEPPRPVLNLLAIARIKILAKQIGVMALFSERDQVVIKFFPTVRIGGDRIMDLVRRNRGRISTVFSRTPSVRIRTTGLSHEVLLELLVDTLRYIGEEQKVASG